MLHRATGIEDNSLERLEAAIAGARDCLLRQLQPASRGKADGDAEGVECGYWIGELEADTTLESDYIFFLYFLGREKHRDKIAKLALYILSRQSEDGTWNTWQGGEGNLSATVKAYVALRIAGYSTKDPVMVRARQAILRMGGVEKVNSFTKFYLALLDQLDWDEVPAIPPEVVLLPRFFYINIYEISYWSRAILVPLSILYAKRTSRRPEEGSLIRELLSQPEVSRRRRRAQGSNGRTPDPAGNGKVHLEELERDGPESAAGETSEPASADNGRLEASGFDEDALADSSRAVALPSPDGDGEQGLFSWAGLFLLTDRILKLAEKTPVKPLRKLALKKAEEWMVARFEDSDGLGAIFPSMINSVMALVALGYPTDHPLVLKGIREVVDLEIEEDGLVRLQPCLSPIWDTAKAVNALHEAGLPPDHESLVAACRWLVSKEVRKPGDWKIRIPHVEVSGWYFQFRNEFYPDVDDTSAVLMALGRVDPDRVEGVEEAIARGIDWILHMQCSNGGWAAFDVNVQREILTKVPYADHNAMLDPPCADITGRCLELLGRFPELRGDPRVEESIQKGIEFLKSFQEEDGAWYGRWGVNYIYGTWQAIKGLVAVGEDPSSEYIRRAVAFLKSHQNSDGGWGETCATYDDPELRGRGASTASQTAWALMGLIAAGEPHSSEVERGVRFLLDRQGPDGNWEEELWTGTGFPGVFYLKYHLYRLYFPLFALGMYRNALRGAPVNGEHGRKRTLRLPARTSAARRRSLRSLIDLVNSG